MNIRPAETSDARSIAEIRVRSWQAAYRELLPQEYLASLSVDNRPSFLPAALASGEPTVLVAVEEGAVVGFSVFGRCRDEDTTVDCRELWAIYLDPTHWSRGIGRALWLASRESLCQMGAQRITLWVLADNRRAIRFYESAGFSADPGHTKFLDLGGVTLLEVRHVLYPDAV
jgi:ribosomal protein S18 acetylase RimI-like enzyme